MRSPPTFPKDGIVTIKVSNILLSNPAFDASLKILNNLNDLIKVVEDFNVVYRNIVRKILMAVHMTTTKSKMFQGSEKYLLNPEPVSLIMHSIVNIKANT